MQSHTLSWLSLGHRARILSCCAPYLLANPIFLVPPRRTSTLISRAVKTASPLPRRPPVVSTRTFLLPIRHPAHVHTVSQGVARGAPRRCESAPRGYEGGGGIEKLERKMGSNGAWCMHSCVNSGADVGCAEGSPKPKCTRGVRLGAQKGELAVSRPERPENTHTICSPSAPRQNVFDWLYVDLATRRRTRMTGGVLEGGTAAGGTRNGNNGMRRRRLVHCRTRMRR
ncbi:hypothetical protein K438DRAFT_1110887 [Mycena galopus ATCC 62051]|nr:hypothetical protein K438DRAFT_1110887 [Mycena galopus ATCC 62051]